MAAGLNHAPAQRILDRRLARRIAPEATIWPREALLRPGREVVIVNLSTSGALIESQARVNPGARAALQFLTHSRREVLGRICRCRVVRLSPLWYEAAVAFDEPFAVSLSTSHG
jgi:hypothetical protein